jgi:hypothetical protein
MVAGTPDRWDEERTPYDPLLIDLTGLDPEARLSGLHKTGDES